MNLDHTVCRPGQEATLGAPREAVRSVACIAGVLLHPGSRHPWAQAWLRAPASFREHAVPALPAPGQAFAPTAVSYPGLLPGCRQRTDQ